MLTLATVTLSILAVMMYAGAIVTATNMIFDKFSLRGVTTLYVLFVLTIVFSFMAFNLATLAVRGG